MIRMVKMIKTIITLEERAEHNGSARLSRNGIEVYSILNNGESLELYHYGTLTLEIDLMNRVICYIYGESRSDCDSINTLLKLYGFDCKTGYKPVNGGFYITRFNKTRFRHELTRKELPIFLKFGDVYTYEETTV